MDSPGPTVFDLLGCRPRDGRARCDGRFLGTAQAERDRRLHELLDDGRVLAGRINADSAALAKITTDVLGLFEASLGWGCGWPTPARRLADEWKLTLPEAKRLVETADILPELPALEEAFSAGELPLSVTASIAAVATPGTVDILVGQSRVQTASQMLRTCAAIKRSLYAEPAPDALPDDYLDFHSLADGTAIRGFLTPAKAELVKKLIEQRRRELNKQTGCRATNVEAFLSLLELEPSLPADRFLAILSVDLDTFTTWQGHRHQPGEGRRPSEGRRPTGVEVLNGPPLSEEELDAIHGQINAVWMVTRGGHPLWISSKSRTAPPWMRPAIRFEQPTCGVQGCGQAGILEAHHSIPYQHKPETCFDELIHLCPFHHRALHAAGASIEHTADRTGVVLYDAEGRPVVFVHHPTPPAQTPDQRTDRARRGPVQDDLGTLTAYAIQSVIDVIAATERRASSGFLTKGADAAAAAAAAKRVPESIRPLAPARLRPWHDPISAGSPIDRSVSNADSGGSSPPRLA